MIYIYIKALDSISGITRTNLLGFNSRKDANARFDLLRRDDNTSSLVMIEGTVVDCWTADTGLTSDDLRTFAISGVDDLSNKENV